VRSLVVGEACVALSEDVTTYYAALGSRDCNAGIEMMNNCYKYVAHVLIINSSGGLHLRVDLCHLPHVQAAFEATPEI
jgi:hypothetical protein